MRTGTIQDSGRRLRGSALAIVLTALMLSLLLEALDQTIVGTAMPRIIGQLRGLDRYAWAVTAYLLASTTMIPIVGKLSDQFGRKWFLLAGVAVFMLGSALCGAAQTSDQLIVFRALQGLGAGIGISLVFTIVGDIFPPAERGRWQGIVAGVYGLSSVIGPTLGGILADHGPLFGSLITDASRWRWVFYINLPLGIVALALLLVYLPADISVRSSEHTGWAAVRRIDAGGAALAATATVCLLLGLTWGGEGASDWGTPRVVTTLVGAGVLYGALIVAERIAIEPILPLHLFRNRVFAADAALSLLLSMTVLGMAFYVPLFLQGVLGVSATQSGTTMTPFSVSIAVGSTLAGIAIGALKRYQIVAILGTLIMTAGILLLTRLTPETGLVYVAFAAVTAGLGMGLLFPVVGLVAQNAVPPTQLGVGSAAVRYLGQLGGTLGAAIVGTVVNQSLASDLERHLSAATITQLATEGVTVTSNPQVLISPAYREAVIQRAIATGARHVPSGPHQGQVVAAVSQHVPHLLTQVFEALRLSLAVAIQHGLVAVLVFCGAAILAACFVTDMPTVPEPANPPGG